MKVSVIVPVYRAEKYLRQCADSILAQTLRDIEVILVDDGSPDACPQIVDEYAAKDARVVPVHQLNGGLSAARKHKDFRMRQLNFNSRRNDERGTISSPRSRSGFLGKILAEKKLREIASYVFWGAATTLVNFLAYAALTRFAGMATVPATAAAWCIAVLFAFFTNKLWVFGSKSLAPALVLRELAAFAAARLMSVGIELVMMWLCVEVLGGNDLFWKVAANIVVIVLNYVFSLLFVFRKEQNEHAD